MLPTRHSASEVIPRRSSRNELPEDAKRTTSTIGQLPVELLGRILEGSNSYSLADDARQRELYYNRLKSYSLVSSHWYRVIHRSRQLWTIIDHRHRLAVVKKALVKSGNAALTVVCDPLRHDARTRPFLQEVMPHMHRWKHLKLALPLEDIPQALFPITAPKLHTLMVHFSPALRTLFTQSPNPREVCMFRSSPPPGLHGLQNLVISGSRNVTYSIRDILFVLQSSPQLQILKLHHLTLTTVRIPDDEPPANLAELQLLSLKTRTADILENILRIMKYPSCTEIRFEVQDMSDDSRPEVVREIMSSIHPSLIRMLSMQPFVTLKRGPAPNETFILMKASQRQKVEMGSIAITGFPSVLVLHQLVSHLKPYFLSADTKFVYRATPDTDEALDVRYLEVLDCLPSIVEMEFANASMVATNVIEHLVKGRVEADGVLRWPCPQLKKMVWENCRTLKIPDVKAFADRGTQGQPMAGAMEAPMKLAAVEAINGNPNEIRRVREGPWKGMDVKLISKEGVG